jgi:hypothetical protein
MQIVDYFQIVVRRGCEKISDFFVVQLGVGDFHHEFCLCEGGDEGGDGETENESE